MRNKTITIENYNKDIKTINFLRNIVLIINNISDMRIYLNNQGIKILTEILLLEVKNLPFICPLVSELFVSVSLSFSSSESSSVSLRPSFST